MFDDINANDVVKLPKLPLPCQVSSLKRDPGCGVESRRPPHHLRLVNSQHWTVSSQAVDPAGHPTPTSDIDRSLVFPTLQELRHLIPMSEMVPVMDAPAVLR